MVLMVCKREFFPKQPVQSWYWGFSVAPRVPGGVFGRWFCRGGRARRLLFSRTALLAASLNPVVFSLADFPASRQER